MVVFELAQLFFDFFLQHLDFEDVSFLFLLLNSHGYLKEKIRPFRYMYVALIILFLWLVIL